MIQEHAIDVVYFRVPRITNAFVAFGRKICAFQTAIIYGRRGQTQTRFVLINLPNKNYNIKCAKKFVSSLHEIKRKPYVETRPSVRPLVI